MVVTHPLFPHGSGTPGFVLHVSVTLGWIVPGLASWYSTQVLPAVNRATPVVPECWILQIAEGLAEAERRGLYTSAQTTPKLATLQNYPILFDDETDTRAWSDILPLARVHNLSVFDAAYLELAQRLRLPLATIDPHLSRAAGVAGVQLFTP